MKSVIVKKDPRGLYTVTIIASDGSLYDSAGFVAPTDALRWVAEFLPLLEPYDETDLSSR